MANILWLTIKPPKMLTEAKVTATNPMTLEKSTSAGPAAISAPTTITDEDRVGDAHQRRMQGRRDAPHHVEADEDGEDKDGEQKKEGIDPCLGLDGGLGGGLGRIGGQLRRVVGQAHRFGGQPGRAFR